MDRWRVYFDKKERTMRLRGRAKTEIWVSPKVSHFDLEKFLADLDLVGFPTSFMKGIELVHFTRFKRKQFGEYYDGQLWIDVRKTRRRKTLVETFVHEVAHHIDAEANWKISPRLTSERKRRGHYIHGVASRHDDEYLARGFERFYSIDPTYRERLKAQNPKLYRLIARLHGKARAR